MGKFGNYGLREPLHCYKLNCLALSTRWLSYMLHKMPVSSHQRTDQKFRNGGQLWSRCSNYQIETNISDFVQVSAVIIRLHWRNHNFCMFINNELETANTVFNKVCSSMLEIILGPAKISKAKDSINFRSFVKIYVLKHSNQ